MRKCYVIADSYTGIQKKQNEDGFFILQESEYFLLGVFDGVGSASGAKKAVDSAMRFVESRAQDFYKNKFFDLSSLVRDLNNEIISSDIFQPFTTCSIVWIPKVCSKKIKFLSLGDSRIYSVGRQHLTQLTTDHNASFDSNMITKYIGKENLSKDSFSETEYLGDENTLLICTDGLYKQVSDLGEFHRILNLKYIKAVKNGLNRLIKGINEDDATYIFVRWENVRN